ncbi:MAG: hypothetical protein EOO60_05665 [Hymenobacter sp.]|nr:MAG: hypothetical protein EOO60_05665 [Hymenobacter sp.]
MPKTDRYLELSTEAFYELLQDDDVKRAYANGFAYSTMEGAQVFKLAGITINERPNTGTALGVAYHKASVGKALGAIDFLVDAGSNGNGNPLYGGIIMSARVWLGAGKLRSDNKGIVALVR